MGKTKRADAGVRSIWVLVALVAAFSLVPVVPGAAADHAPFPKLGAASRTDLPHSPDHVLVEVAPDANPENVLGKGAEAVVGRWYTAPVAPGKTPMETVTGLLSRTGVATVELDYRVSVEPELRQSPIAQSQAVPVNDPLYPYQWHFPAVRADEAWSTSTGIGVVVAVLDTGISQGGVDLDCHTFVASYNAITETAGAAAASDDNGHGTHVAGTVGQCTNNGVGVAGVAFDASLMPVKVLNNEGDGDFSWIAKGINWAKDNGADVINMSLGCPQPCSSSLVDDVVEAARDAGVVIVAASGNDAALSVSYPASHPDVIAVGATDNGNVRAAYSNRGSALDLVAPGGDVDPDVFGGVLQETFGGSGWTYYFSEGTSMATPHVSGAAALLLSVDPGVDPGEIQQILQDTALDLGPAGFDNSHGYGLIQICDALSSRVTDNTSPTWPGSAQLTTSNITGTSVELAWQPASDETCLDGYHVYQGNKLVKTAGLSQTNTTVSGLTPATDYTIEVRATDTSGNLSQALSAQVTTLDTVPPKWGADAAVSVLTYGETSLKLGWDPAADNVGVTGYRLRVDGTTAATSTNREFNLTGLHPGTQHHVEVLARDRAGNWSDSLKSVVQTAHRFGDTSGHTFYSDILWMSGSGVTRGCNPPVNDLFCPDDPVTRGQMAAFLVRALGLTADTHPGFGDVPVDSTFAGDIGRLATAGITRGCNPPDNDRFCPDDPVTRAQMGAFLVRALGLTENTHPGFGDVPSGSTFAGDIGRLATAGITRGCNPPVNDLFCPEDAVTRGQLAAFLRRALG